MKRPVPDTEDTEAIEVDDVARVEFDLGKAVLEEVEEVPAAAAVAEPEVAAAGVEAPAAATMENWFD